MYTYMRCVGHTREAMHDDDARAAAAGAAAPSRTRGRRRGLMAVATTKAVAALGAAAAALAVVQQQAPCTAHAFVVPRAPWGLQVYHQHQHQHQLGTTRIKARVCLASSSGGASEDEVVDLSGDGGVTKRVIRPGFGYKQETPPPHAYCKVAFIMKTSTGQIIADRMDKPMEFMLGLEKPEVIPGWELAVASMKPNEVAEVTCCPEYAFGDSAGYEDKIPPGSTIVTRLQLLNWRALKGAGSTDVADTYELSEKWRRELDEGVSPMTDWAAPPKKKKAAAGAPPTPTRIEDVQDTSAPPSSGGGPLADAQAAMDGQQQQPPPPKVDADGFTEPSAGMTAGPPPQSLVEEIPSDGPKPKVDIDDPATREKLNKNQVVVGTGPQYRWKERQDHLELVVPVPDEVRKQDVLVHLTNRVLMVGFKTPEGKENWIVGGDLFGPIEKEESFWVLSKDFEDELTEGKSCIEVRLEKKEPFRRIWANVFKDQ